MSLSTISNLSQYHNCGKRTLSARATNPVHSVLKLKARPHGPIVQQNSDLVNDAGLGMELVHAGGRGQLDGGQISVPEAAEEVQRWIGPHVLADAHLQVQPGVRIIIKVRS